MPFDDLLVRRTRDLIDTLRKVAREGEIPPPLEGSAKCVRCSLAGICLPDEVNFLREMEKEEDEVKTARRLVPSRDDQVPVYVVGHGQMVKRGDRLEFWSREIKWGSKAEKSPSYPCGGRITTPALADAQRVCRYAIIRMAAGSMWISQGTPKNVELRIRQFDRAGDAESLKIARSFIPARSGTLEPSSGERPRPSKEGLNVTQSSGKRGRGGRKRRELAWDRRGSSPDLLLAVQ